MPLKMLDKTAESGMKSNKCKNRNDIGCKSIEIAWHVCFYSAKVSASMFNEITVWESQEVQAECVAQAKEEAIYAEHSETFSGASMLQDQKRLGHTRNSDNLTNLLAKNGQSRNSDGK